MNREAKDKSKVVQYSQRVRVLMFCPKGSSMVQAKFQADIAGLVMQALSSRAEEDEDSLPASLETAQSDGGS